MSPTQRIHRRKLPTYFVSARNGSRFHAGIASHWYPYGLQHARRVGSPLTACGITAVEWTMFWELAFPQSPEESCKSCLAVVRFAEQEAQRFADLAGAAQ